MGVIQMIRIIIDVDENRKGNKKIITSFQTKDLKYSEAASSVFEMNRLIGVLTDLEFEEGELSYEVDEE